MNTAMARDSGNFLDGVLHGASGAGGASGASVQRTVDSLQQTVDMRTNAPTGRVDRNWTKSGEKAP